MKKCLVACLLAVTILISVLSVGATEVATFTVNMSAEMPAAGEAFEVTVSISNNPGFCAFQFTLVYDKAQLECKGATIGELVESAINVSNPNAEAGAIVGGASLTPVEGDGVVAVFNFTAKSDVSALAFDMQDVSLADEDVKSIPYQIVGASESKSERPAPSVPGRRPAGSGSTVKPEEETELPVEETEPETSVFPDANGHWGVSYINKAAEKGLFKGDENGNFNPNANVTRGQFITVLWRVAGSPVATIAAPFTDIGGQNEEFKNAILWGYEKGYINGTTETTFEPDATLTREAAMKILHYYAGGKVDKEQFLHAVYDGIFKDSPEISDWAKPSLYWGVYNELLAGTSATTLSPQGTATRAQLAKIMVNYLNY